MELKDIKRIEEEGTMMELSKEDRIKGGIILKEVGKNYMRDLFLGSNLLKQRCQLGEQMSIPMGSVTYKADMKQKTSNKAVVKDEEFIEVLKRLVILSILKKQLIRVRYIKMLLVS